MPIAALWYGVIIGEMVYFGGEWVGKWRTKKRAALRKEADRKRARLEHQKQKSLVPTSTTRSNHYHRHHHQQQQQSTYPVYEEYESDNGYDDEYDESRHRPRYFLQGRSQSTPGRERGIEYEYNARHAGYPTDRARSYQGPSPATNMDRTLVLAGDSMPSSGVYRGFTMDSIANMTYAEARSLAVDESLDSTTREAAYEQLVRLERQWRRTRQGQYT